MLVEVSTSMSGRGSVSEPRRRRRRGRSPRRHEVLLHRAQALADVAMHPGVHEGDAPFADVAREQLDVLLAAARTESTKSLARASL